MIAAQFILDALLYFISSAVYINVFIIVSGYWNLWTHCRIMWQTRTFRTVCIEPQEILHYWWGTLPWSEGGSVTCLVRWSNSQGPYSFTSQLTPLNTYEYGVSLFLMGIESLDCFLQHDGALSHTCPRAWVHMHAFFGKDHVMSKGL